MKKTMLFVSVLISFLLIGILVTYAKGIQNGISNSLLRLHVIANSDSEEDQTLKLSVRDKIIEETKELFAQSGSAEQTKQIAQENLEKFKQIAQNEIAAQGYDYDVDIKIGNFPFPTKMYGNVMLPAGRYEAVRVIIGSGEGQNWWCVLFPPLCIVNGTRVELSQEAKNELKASLTNEEYNLITENNPDNMPVQIKFKIVEILAPLFNK